MFRNHRFGGEWIREKTIQKFTGLTQLYLRSLHFNRSHPISNSGVDP
jgi:hypothetical protein